MLSSNHALTAVQIRHLVALTEDIAKDARHRCLNRDYSISLKDDNSPVTSVDHAISTLLGQELPKILPVPIICEEEECQGAFTNELFWLVDPIDGTKAFISQNGPFTVNISLVADGLPILGIIAAPMQFQIFYTDHLQQAYRYDSKGHRRIYASGHQHLKHILLSCRQKNPDFTCCDQPFNAQSHTEAFINPKTFNLISDLHIEQASFISSSYKFCMVADGRADLYLQLGDTSIWDAAAGQALVEAAGGLVADLTGKRLSYSVANTQNPKFYAINNQHKILSLKEYL